MDSRYDGHQPARPASRPAPRPATVEPQDSLVREPLSPAAPTSTPSMPSTRRTPILVALAALMVLAIVGTAALVAHDVQEQRVSPPLVHTSATATLVSGTPTANPLDPRTNGWTLVVSGQFDDVAFAPSSPQRGYMCSWDDTSQQHSFGGVTTDGGQTWANVGSPAAYPDCQVQISATNPLDIALSSDSGPGAGAASFDAHYSTDGGQTWHAAPLPQNAVLPGGELWAGSYLYAWTGPNKDNGQHGSLQVSANSGPFTSIDPSTLLPSAQNTSITSVVAASKTIYLTLGYNGCSAQNCWGIMASSDGGKTWSQVPNKDSIMLQAVVGGTLYGQMQSGPDVTAVLSTDNGSTWSARSLPPLPNGDDVSWCIPALDGNCYVTTKGPSVAYQRGGSWSLIPVSSDPNAGALVVAVSFDSSGHAQRVWVVGGGRPQPGLYSHTLP